MVALSTLLSVIAISIVIVRVATKALDSTGLSQDAARFSAFSAFNGTGFITEEAEGVVRHPVRSGMLVAGPLLLWMLARSHWVERGLGRLMEPGWRGGDSSTPISRTRGCSCSPSSGRTGSTSARRVARFGCRPATRSRCTGAGGCWAN
jgi:hypothetical protein